MAKPFSLDMLTPTGKIFSGEVSSLTVPAGNGYLGVLADHAPLVASLGKGNISMIDVSGKNILYVSSGSGFLSVIHNKAVLVAESVSKNS